MNDRTETLVGAVQSEPRIQAHPDRLQQFVSDLITLRFVLVLLPVAMAIFILQALWSHTASVPFQDEWDNVPMVHHFLTGTFSLSEVWAFHNQHRIVIPRLIDLMLTVVTHWNRQIEMTVDVAFAALSLWLFFDALKKTLRSNPITWALLIPFSLLMLSFGQFENWLEPFQITFILTIVGVACCVRGLASGRTSIVGFVLAICGAVLAALSSLGGTIAFVAFFPVVLYLGWRRAAVWLIVALGVLIPYFIGFPHSTFNLQLLGIVQYGLTYLGAPLVGWHLEEALISGLIGLVLAAGSVVIYWRQHGTLSLMAPWIGLALFGLGVAGMTALGRGTGGLVYSLSSRYQAFSGVWWVAIFALMAICLTEIPHSFKFPRVSGSIDQRLAGNGPLIVQGYGSLLGASVVLLIVLANLNAIPAVQTFQLGQFEQESCIQQYLESPPDCFQSFYPYPGTAQDYSAVLQADNMGIFYSSGPGRTTLQHLSPGSARSQSLCRSIDAHLLDCGCIEREAVGLRYGSAV